ncbi:MAG TPA: tetratricopeptide repeat protein [Pyrinomonadaceae bacterium]|nr:tetratricopeptide repeat protein [Pyrinomonadaceae bacterium]
MNRKKLTQSCRLQLVVCCLLFGFVAPGAFAQGEKGPAQKKPTPAAKRTTPAAKKPAAGERQAQAGVALSPEDEAALKARLEEILKLPAWERVAELEDFLDLEMPDALELRALEHMVSSLAAFADERLRAGETARGVDLFRQAVRVAPDDMSDRLFVEVVSQFPANLYLLGQREAAFELMGRIERRVKDNPKRLLALAPFYLNMERADEAARLAAAAVKLAPGMPMAHLALGAALRQSLRLEEAEREYARALELDPKSTAARQSLGDLRRAAGRAGEALALYRELLDSDPKNAGARGGLVLALFDAGQREEAERELEAALSEDPKNLPLLAGAAYWHAARGDSRRALELAERAVNVEPRHPWAQIALARALVAAKRPLDAERALRFARLHANFPTLDYELANALAAAGLYDEAAETLAERFTLKGGRVASRLAGRVEATNESFVELLAPERRASFFQHAAAETEENARRLKSLLALYASTRASDESAPNEAAVAAVAEQFARGDDEMRAFRQLYAANRLLRRRAAVPTALALIDAARKSVEAGLEAPQAPVAAMADDLRELRERAIRQGASAGVPEVSRSMLSNIVRGRIEEAHGWALFNQGKVEEAIASLRAALTVLPETSGYWRAAQWRLGVALATAGNQREALASYIKAYDPNRPDPARRAVITALYRKVHGSTAGIDLRLPSAVEAQGAAQSQPLAQPDPTASPSPEVRADETKRDEPTPAPESAPMPSPSPESTPAPEATPDVAPSPEPSPEGARAREGAAPTPAAKTVETGNAKTAADAARPAETAGAPSRAGRTRRTFPTREQCTLAVAGESLSLAVGGSATIVARLEGGGDLTRLTATTPHWSDIVILREPSNDAEPDTARFTINSISRTPGTFSVALKSPCGTKEITITVK